MLMLVSPLISNLLGESEQKGAKLNTMQNNTAEKNRLVWIQQK